MRNRRRTIALSIVTIIYVLIVLNEASLPGQDVILAVTVTTIFFSVFAHGMTAVPASNWYQRMMHRMMDESPEEMEAMPEMEPVTEMRTRRGM